MSSFLVSALQPCSKSGSNRWLRRAERILSASCMGWCLQAAFKEHPKSMTLACVGGASSMSCINLFSHARSINPLLLGAGVFITFAGTAGCLILALNEHPTVAIKACISSALGVSLARSLIVKGAKGCLATSQRTPKKVSRTKECGTQCDYVSPLQTEVQSVGRTLNRFSRKFKCRDYVTLTFENDRIRYLLF